MERLTKQELAVATILAEEGATNEEIARRMHLSTTTVKTYIWHATMKLHAKNRTHLALLVCRQERPCE
jgi:DNA-binding NarL/FixJ family response regulator